MVLEQDQSKVDSLRIFRDEYALRDLYINCFETCHKALKWAIGIANAHSHGDPDMFALPPSIEKSKKQPPKTLMLSMI